MISWFRKLLACHIFIGYADRKNLAPVYDYLVRRIRSVDRKKLIFFEGVTWSVESSGEFAGPGFKHVPGGLDDPSEFKRSVFSYHYYCQLIEFANFSRGYPILTRFLCHEVSWFLC